MAKWTMYIRDCIDCNCIETFRQQFPSKTNFYQYGHAVRQKFSESQRWPRVKISTRFGLKKSVIFRSVLNIIVSEVKDAGRASTVQEFRYE